MKFLAGAVLGALTGYAFAVFAASVRELRDAIPPVSQERINRVTEPFHGRNVVPVTSLTDTTSQPITVTVLPAWGTLYSRDEA